MRKYGRGKRRYYRKKRQTLAKKVDKLSKIVRSRKPELKYVLSAAGFTANNDYSAMIDLYPQITQSLLDSGGRIGDKITMKSVRLRLRMQASYDNGDRAFRIIAFIYKNNPDAIVTNFATIGNLLMNSAFANSAEAIMSPYDYDNFKNFKILFDKVYKVPTSNSALLSSGVGTIKWYDWKFRIPRQYQQVQFQAGGNTVSRNQLLFLVIGDTDVWTGAYVCQGTYIDN